MPWVSLTDAKAHHGSWIDDTAEHTNALGIANSSARVLPAGTVCLSRTASVGYVAVLRRPMATSQDFVNWVCGDRLVPHFLKYLLLAEGKKGLLHFAAGSVHQTIYFPEAKAFHICHPEVDEQRRIVAVLDEALAGIADARANAERNLRNARALFDTQLDRLFAAPGLQTVPISDVAKVFDGPHATPRTVAEGPIFLGISALQDGRVNLGETRHVTPGDFATWTRRVRPQAGDVAFSYETRLGQAALIPEGLECCLGRRMGLVRLDRAKLDPRYFVYQYLAPPFQRLLAAKTVRGATVDRIPVKDFPSFPVVVPPMAEQRRVADLIERLRDECDALGAIYRRKLAALDELKESLLHHAFTGQLTESRATRAHLTSPLDRHAGVIAVAHRLHAWRGREHTFGRVKAEKVAHLVESHLGLDLGRTPVKEAAGPYDREQRKFVQRHARKAGYFVFEGSRATGYHLRELANFDALVERTRASLGDRYAEVERLVGLMAPMRTYHAEVFATTYAAWNNLLIDGRPATDAAIVREAREDWHPHKLRIPPEHFLKVIAWMRRRGVTPSGAGRRVADPDPPPALAG